MVASDDVKVFDRSPLLEFPLSPIFIDPVKEIIAVIENKGESFQRDLIVQLVVIHCVSTYGKGVSSIGSC